MLLDCICSDPGRGAGAKKVSVEAHAPRTTCQFGNYVRIVIVMTAIN